MGMRERLTLFGACVISSETGDGATPEKRVGLPRRQCGESTTQFPTLRSDSPAPRTRARAPVAKLEKKLPRVRLGVIPDQNCAERSRERQFRGGQPAGKLTSTIAARMRVQTASDDGNVLPVGGTLVRRGVCAPSTLGIFLRDSAFGQANRQEYRAPGA
jgi:hypothetical protein